MIAGLQGKLELLGDGWAIINVNGIAFRVHMPTSGLSSLGKVGEEVRIYTHFHLREDNAALYGFTSADELRLFQTLLGVSGLGPKLALAMLSAMSPDKLAMAIAGGNADLLTAVPGIGKKVAQRIILELRDKIGVSWMTPAGVQVAEGNAEVLSALTSLGYSVAEASRAVATLLPDPELSLEEKIKLALQYFAEK